MDIKVWPREGGTLTASDDEGLQNGSGERSATDASLQFYLERSPLMMGTVAVLADGDLLHLYDNPATTRFFGMEPGQSQGKTARSLGVPEATITLWREHYLQAAARGEHQSFEYLHQRAEGGRILAVTVSALEQLTAAGEPMCSYIAEDVTEKRSSERSLRDSETRLRALFDQAAVGLALVALDGRWERVNRRLCEMLGYSEAEFVRLTFQDISHPEDLADDLANVERLLAGEAGDSYRMEKRYFRRDGSELWAQLTVSLIRDANGAPERFVSVVEDIDARKAAQKALRMTERRLAMATRASGVGVWEWDATRPGVHYSPQARQICGFSADEPLTIDRILEQIHPEDRLIVRGRVSRGRNEHELSEVAFRVIHPEKGVRWIRSFSTAVSDSEDGPASHLFGTLEDVTDQRLILQRLEASEARLRLAVEAGRMAVFEWPLDLAEPPLTPELKAQLGVKDERYATVEARRARYHPEDAALVGSTRQRALESGERFLDFEFRYFRPDGEMRWLEVRSEILRDAFGEPLKLVGVQTDITDQREKEERLRLLVHEVDHRANNLLSVVQSVVALSKADDIEGLRGVVASRIRALAHTHQLLSETRWAGADLRRLAEEELRPYGLGNEKRIKLTGPAVELSPAQAQGLGMVLHELATNAAKHGALSAAAGKLTLAWTCTDGALDLRWRERGGPPAHPPRRRGFGLTLLARSLSGPVEGSVDCDWAAEGLTAQIRLRLRD